MRSKSRGSVWPRSADPLEHPRIRFNYTGHEDDRIEMRARVRLTCADFAQDASNPYRGREIQPGSDLGRRETDIGETIGEKPRDPR